MDMDLVDLYRDIVETSPDGIWVLDLAGRTIYANPEIARMHRVPEDALSTLTVLDTLDDAGRARFAEHLDAVRQGRVEAAEFETQWVRSDGDTLWVLCRETALADDEGRPRALLRRYVDNTERHELIASLRASEDALGDQVTQNILMQAVASAANEAGTLAEVLAQARSLVLLHDDWERARAFVPAADGSGRVEPFYVIDADRESDADDAQAAAELELAQASYDARGAVWDERRLTFAFPVLLGDEVYAVVVITSAPPLWRFEMIESMAARVSEQLARVAERERAQAELALARDEAMEASRQKSEFLATMSHEIRTPLNGVIGLNDLLLRTGLTPEQQRLAAGVQVASRTLLGLINDILDLSKIEAGRLELEQVDFGVRPLLDQVAGMLAGAARDKGLDLVISCHPDVPAVLSGDPTRVSQVLTNLVSNAVKFTERGGVVVRVTSGPVGERVQLQIEVRDSGVGVPEDKLRDLFDPFTQADSSHTRIYGGTGLGLAITREIVEAMGGTIEYAPNPGGGSVFACTVLLEPGADDGTADRSDTAGDRRAREMLTGRRALVVDDIETNRLILREQLAWWGVESDSVASVAEGLARLEVSTYDVVLVDLAMPEQDGLDLARQVRADAALDRVPMLLLSSAPPMDRDQVRAAGIDEVLAKPVLSSVLRGALVQLLVGEPEPSPVLAEETGELPSKGRILVVEDNPVNQMVATGLLAALGYTTVTVNDGLAAIDAAREEDVDAILMDVQMPNLDGYTATQRIRAQETGPRRVIIAMTAAAVEGERERCLAAGMDDYLTKPVDAALLAETLERWLMPAPAYAARLDLQRLEELRQLDNPDDGSSYVDRAIENFLASAPGDLSVLTSAADAGDAHQLRAVAHRLAGAALNLGAVAVGRAAQAVEEHAAAGEAGGAPLPELEAQLIGDLAALRDYQREQFPTRAR
jgi:PAS domain S-box-containing protein